MHDNSSSDDPFLDTIDKEFSAQSDIINVCLPEDVD